MQLKMLLLSIFVTLVTCGLGGASVLDWIWTTKADDTTVLVADGVPLVSIPYESMTEDEKFLREAAKLTDIQVSSPLETCQHKVIMKIRTSCSDMTEEQLAKLSVNLLNCQSAVEGRKTFPCTEEMSLKQCTTDMDADMWNAYHLMSNRARAVCYAARSTQFRALTELTVNKLMQSAHSQIDALQSLRKNQDRLEEQTTEALSSLSEGNKALLEQQRYLKAAQTTAHNLVTTNLRELTNEKALIRSGHAQLAVMAADIRDKLDKAHKDLELQAVEREENHQEILQDLINIQEQAQSIWEKVESSSSHILEQHKETIEQYEQTLQKLAQINDTIQYIWNLTNAMRAEVDEKLGWITNYIGDTGEQMQRMYRTFLHVAYLLVAMIVAAFLQAPFLTRATIMSILPVNLITYWKRGPEVSLDFISMTVLIFLITAMHFVMLGIQRAFGAIGPTARVEEPVKLINRNEHVNGDVHEYASSSYSNFISNMRLHTRLMEQTQRLYDFVVSQLNRCREIVSALIQSTVLRPRRSLNSREELSCSYQPSMKKREDVVYVSQQTPCMTSDDDIGMQSTMDCDCSSISSTRNYNDDHNGDGISDMVDAHELKRRLGRINSRSSTPSYVSPKIHCLGVTRTGKRCRLFASPGQYYCYRHTTGTSIAGDYLN
ncbi:hypothetical protein DMN91_009181 [Ooceraea biroi]|uniref:Protein brambleberry n=1 Tax=Ooceraea biroi TaxID=2015173 RepID=A0A026WRR3_OOCBI|nr:protein brambleberry [Ooceraea biroi]XP_026827973.1 protein brambleberry [Ooceraea biroi]EZA58740.1 hypothetical protein X777_14909 [Ooceraea biroi]RLU18824.1 hypothetical protein DMN91_009181 [Ooceraea biroi]